MESRARAEAEAMTYGQAVQEAAWLLTNTAPTVWVRAIADRVSAGPRSLGDALTV